MTDDFRVQLGTGTYNSHPDARWKERPMSKHATLADLWAEAAGWALGGWHPMTGDKKHVWIKNAAFERLTGLARVCMDCGLALERGERLIEKVCPGKREPIR